MSNYSPLTTGILSAYQAFYQKFGWLERDEPNDTPFATPNSKQLFTGLGLDTEAQTATLIASITT